MQYGTKATNENSCKWLAVTDILSIFLKPILFLWLKDLAA